MAYRYLNGGGSDPFFTLRKRTFLVCIGGRYDWRLVNVFGRVIGISALFSIKC